MIDDRAPLVDFLLCAADLARAGHVFPLSTLTEEHTGDEIFRLAYEARDAALDVSSHVFDYRGDLLADALLEAAYRVAEGKL